MSLQLYADARTALAPRAEVGPALRPRASCGSACRSGSTARPRGRRPGSGPGTSPPRRRGCGSRRSWRRERRCPPRASRPPRRAAPSSCGRRRRADGPQRVDPRPPQRLVRVDVPHAGDPLLGEQERLDRRAPAAGQGAQRLGREVRRPSGSTPSREAKYSSRAAAPSSTTPVPKRRTSANSRRSPAVQRASGRATWRGVLRPARRAAGCRSSAGASRGTPRPRAPARGTCRAAPPPRSAGPLTASSTSTGAAGSHQRASSTSSGSQRPALEVRRQLAPDRLDLGQLGQLALLLLLFLGFGGFCTLPLSFSERSSGSKTVAVGARELGRRRQQLDHVLGVALVDVHAAGPQPAARDGLVAHQLDRLRPVQLGQARAGAARSRGRASRPP